MESKELSEQYPKLINLIKDCSSKYPHLSGFKKKNLDKNIYYGEICEILKEFEGDKNAVFTILIAFFNAGLYRTKILHSMVDDYYRSHQVPISIEDRILKIKENYPFKEDERKAKEQFYETLLTKLCQKKLYKCFPHIIPIYIHFDFFIFGRGGRINKEYLLTIFIYCHSNIDKYDYNSPAYKQSISFFKSLYIKFLQLLTINIKIKDKWLKYSFHALYNNGSKDIVPKIVEYIL